LALFRRFQRATGGMDRNGGGGGGGESGGVLRRAAATASGVPNARLPAGTAIYNAAITACGRGSYTEEALEIFQEMSERGVPRNEVRRRQRRPWVCFVVFFSVAAEGRKGLFRSGLPTENDDRFYLRC